MLFYAIYRLVLAVAYIGVSALLEVGSAGSIFNLGASSERLILFIAFELLYCTGALPLAYYALKIEWEWSTFFLFNAVIVLIEIISSCLIYFAIYHVLGFQHSAFPEEDQGAFTAMQFFPALVLNLFLFNAFFVFKPRSKTAQQL